MSLRRVDANGTIGDVFEPFVVGAVGRRKWHSLGVDNDNARP